MCTYTTTIMYIYTYINKHINMVRAFRICCIPYCILLCRLMFSDPIRLLIYVRWTWFTFCCPKYGRTPWLCVSTTCIYRVACSVFASNQCNIVESLISWLNSMLSCFNGARASEIPRGAPVHWSIVAGAKWEKKERVDWYLDTGLLLGSSQDHFFMTYVT